MHTISLVALSLIASLFPTPAFPASPPLQIDCSSSQLQMNLSSPFNASNLVVQCFHNPAPPASPYLRPIVIDDYFEILQKIMVQDDAMLQRRWNLGPSGTGQWKVNQAVLGLCAPWPPSTDIFQTVLVAHAAALIADRCLREDEGYLGGQTWLGLRGTFRIVLLSPIQRHDHTFAIS